MNVIEPSFRALVQVFGVLVSGLVIAAPLPVYNLDADQTSVSGISSGGYMAVQYGVAHSKTVAGVGVFAGGPYRCADGVSEALGTCMLGTPDIGHSVAETESAAEAGRVDPVANIARQRIWLFSGYNDGVVKQEVMDGLYDYYQRFVPTHQIYYQDTHEAGHAIVTERYGTECSLTADEFINDCDYDGAGLLLQHIYGRLAPRSEGELSGEFVTFDQDAFTAGDSRAKSMAREAYLYAPADCASGERCRLHVAFHGCRQYAGAIGDAFYRHAGYNEWADTNHLVVLYPQTVESHLDPVNSKGCWDWWGYNGPDFAFKVGDQIAAVRAMVERLSSGSGPNSSPTTGDALRLEATDAADDAVALAWTRSDSAELYHLYRASDPTGPFDELAMVSAATNSYVDSGLEPDTSYSYQVRAAVNGIEYSSEIASITTRAPAPECDPYFSDNVTHVHRGRAQVWFGVVFARGSWDYMGFYNLLTETALYWDGDAYQVGVCP